MSESELDLDMEDLVSAEDFLEYFDVEYEPSVVHVNRLHILQRYHDYLSRTSDLPAEDQQRRELHAQLLGRAYNDFVTSDALTEKVFRVFRMHEPASVPLSDLTQQIGSHATKI